MHAFAAVVSEARGPAEIRLALVSMAQQLSSADRVDLEQDDPVRGPRRLASWPEPRSAWTPTRIESTPESLCLPLRFEGRVRGTLRLRTNQPRRWPIGLVRRLSTLCALASAAERAFETRQSTIDEPETDPITGLHNGAFLDLYLPHALSLSQRRSEPVSLLDLGTDRVSETALRSVSQAVAGTLRGSDLVARLDDGRVVVVLPGASAADALVVAEALRRALSEIDEISIGVAAYPQHAQDASSLRLAAASALARAREANEPHATTVLAPPIRHRTKLSGSYSI
jgi:diguanylate cyclase (GGDEF)-like protein